jgi:Uma2 family endonuclease
MSTTAGTMTADELLLLPDDGMRHELVTGELTTMAPPGAEHGDVSLAIGALLRTHVQPRGLGRATATVYRGRGAVSVYSGGEEIDIGDAVPGWRFNVTDLFV